MFNKRYNHAFTADGILHIAIYAFKHSIRKRFNQTEEDTGLIFGRILLWE